MLEHFEADIPEVMIEAQIDRIVEDFGYRLSMQGVHTGYVPEDERYVHGILPQAVP